MFLPRTGFRQRAFTRKPLKIVHAEEAANKLPRTLSFWDLLAIGIGGTVGSGVFVLTGFIAHNYAGPAGAISWIVAGIGCAISGLSYAELAGRIPSAGAGYAYTFVAIGELPAVLVAWLVTLEYGISGAATARSWGDKMSLYIRAATNADYGGGKGVEWLLVGPGGMSTLAAAMQALCVFVVLLGMEANKRVTNFFCVTKLLVIAFMVVAALALWQPENLTPFAPHGVSGVLRGSVAAVFGYLGFDEVCLLSMEAKDPHRSVPRALAVTVACVGAIFVLVSLALCGVLPSDQLDEQAGFPEAFREHGAHWAYHVAALGEVITLPLIVLVSFMAQPRLQYALAEDGLLPAIFGAVTPGGTLMWGSLLSGAVCVVVAAWMPFRYLDEVISSGVLVSFSMTNAALIVMRHQPLGPPSPHSLANSNGADDGSSCGGGGSKGGCDACQLDKDGGMGVSCIGVNGCHHRRRVMSEGSQDTRPEPLQSPTLQRSSSHGFRRRLDRGVRYLQRFHRTADARLRVFWLNFAACLAAVAGTAAAAAARQGAAGRAAVLSVVTALFAGAAALITAGIAAHTGEPGPTSPGGEATHFSDDGYRLFRVPMVPWLPAIGSVLNYYLIAQQSLLSWAMLGAYLSAAVLFYLCYGMRHSVGSNSGWEELLAEGEGVGGPRRGQKGGHFPLWGSDAVQQAEEDEGSGAAALATTSLDSSALEGDVPTSFKRVYADGAPLLAAAAVRSDDDPAKAAAAQLADV